MGEQRGLAPLLTVDLAPVTVELNLRESGARFPCKWSSVLEIYIKRMKGVISLKKRIIPLILLLAMLLSLSAYAASPRVMTILPAISFDGTTANCRVSVSADRSTDQISAVIQLWNGSTRIARWTDSGTGYLLFSNSATVSKGKTYELTVDVKINGVSKPQVSIEGTCK